MTENHDDGGLECLGIDIAEETKYFNCERTNQKKIVNTTFYVIDIIENVDTSRGPDRTLVKIKTKLTDSESDARKFFTNSTEIKVVLKKVKEMGKLPRKVTLRCIENRYFLE